MNYILLHIIIIIIFNYYGLPSTLQSYHIASISGKIIDCWLQNMLSPLINFQWRIPTSDVVHIEDQNGKERAVLEGGLVQVGDEILSQLEVSNRNWKSTRKFSEVALGKVNEGQRGWVKLKAKVVGQGISPEILMNWMEWWEEELFSYYLWEN